MIRNMVEFEISRIVVMISRPLFKNMVIFVNIMNIIRDYGSCSLSLMII